MTQSAAQHQSSEHTCSLTGDAAVASDAVSTGQTDPALAPAVPADSRQLVRSCGWCVVALTVIVMIRHHLESWNSPADHPRPAAARFVVDINRAELGELKALPEVGPALAERIIKFRQSQGTIASVDDLRHVPGIGPRTLEQLRPMLRVD